MYQEWDAENIRWYVNAETYTGFFRQLAVEIAPLLSGYRSLCDLGCGPALFDFEIAHLMENIDCVDKNDVALASVKERAQAFGLTNIQPQLADCERLTGRWDIAFMSFFGSRNLTRYLPLCKRLIAVVSEQSETALFPQEHRAFARHTAEETARDLQSKGLTFELIWKRLAFGQPFVSLDDAQSYLKAHSPESSAAELDEFLAQKMVMTGQPAYPYYIPRTKTVGIFVLDGGLA